MPPITAVLFVVRLLDSTLPEQQNNNFGPLTLHWCQNCCTVMVVHCLLNLTLPECQNDKLQVQHKFHGISERLMQVSCLRVWKCLVCTLKCCSLVFALQHHLSIEKKAQISPHNKLNIFTSINLMQVTDKLTLIALQHFTEKILLGNCFSSSGNSDNNLKRRHLTCKTKPQLQTSFFHRIFYCIITYQN